MCSARPAQSLVAAPLSRDCNGDSPDCSWLPEEFTSPSFPVRSQFAFETVRLDSAGDYLVAITFWASDDDFDLGCGPVATTSFGFMIAKLAREDGGCLWQRVLNGEGAASPRLSGLDLTNAGDVVIAGLFDNPGVDFGGGLVSAATTGKNVFIAKYDGDTGSLEWVNSRPPLDSESAVTGVAAMQRSGDLVLVGSSLNGSSFILVYAADGTTVRWEKQISGTSISANDVAVDSTGAVAVTGSFVGTIDLGDGVSRASIGGGRDLFVAMYEGADGTLRWGRTFGGTESFDFDEGRAVEFDSVTGDLFLAGRFTGKTTRMAAIGEGGCPLSVRGIGPVASQPFDLFIGKYRMADGVHLWSRKIGGSDVELITDLVADRNGNVVLSGRAREYFDWDCPIGTPGPCTAIPEGIDFGDGLLFGANAFLPIEDLQRDAPPIVQNWDGFVVKYQGSDGSHLWSERYSPGVDGTISEISAISLDPDDDGAIIIAEGFETFEFSLEGVSAVKGYLERIRDPDTLVATPPPVCPGRPCDFDAECADVNLCNGSESCVQFICRVEAFDIGQEGMLCTDVGAACSGPDCGVCNGGTCILNVGSIPVGDEVMVQLDAAGSEIKPFVFTKHHEEFTAPTAVDGIFPKAHAVLYESPDGVYDWPIVLATGFPLPGDGPAGLSCREWEAVDGVWITRTPTEQMVCNLTQFYKGNSDLLNLLREAGWDIWLVHYERAEAPLLTNAELLLQAIQHSAFTHDDGAIKGETVVMGLSLGGILSRIALASAEDQNIPHGAGMFVSLDAPHYGAHVNPWLLAYSERHNLMQRGWPGQDPCASGTISFDDVTTGDPNDTVTFPRSNPFSPPSRCYDWEIRPYALRELLIGVGTGWSYVPDAGNLIPNRPIEDCDLCGDAGDWLETVQAVADIYGFVTFNAWSWGANILGIGGGIFGDGDKIDYWPSCTSGGIVYVDKGFSALQSTVNRYNRFRYSASELSLSPWLETLHTRRDGWPKKTFNLGLSLGSFTPRPTPPPVIAYLDITMTCDQTYAIHPNDGIRGSTLPTGVLTEFREAGKGDFDLELGLNFDIDLGDIEGFSKFEMSLSYEPTFIPLSSSLAVTLNSGVDMEFNAATDFDRVVYPNVTLEHSLGPLDPSKPEELVERVRIIDFIVAHLGAFRRAPDALRKARRGAYRDGTEFFVGGDDRDMDGNPSVVSGGTDAADYDRTRTTGHTEGLLPPAVHDHVREDLDL